MKVLFWKYVINSSFGISVESQLAKEYGYIYNTPPEYYSIIEELFEENYETTYYMIIVGHSDELDKIWISQCRLFKGHKLRIENASLLDTAASKEFIQKFCKEKPNAKKPFLFTTEINDQDLYAFLNIKRVIKKDRKDKYAEITESNLNKKVIKYENGLDKLAQKSAYARRPIGYHKPEENILRTEFQRDRERIVHCKAYRRLVDKAQIYTSSKGDHFRTRLTHSLEVSQIARAIARELELNEDLTEAIALGHDLGHTPFGHEGERELDLIMSGQIPLYNVVDIRLAGLDPDSFKYESIDFGGFKHNYQGVRIVNYLEEKYESHEGLDLSYQVMEGILKHTSINSRFNIDEFFLIGDKKYLYLDISFPTTLEGQIVAISDEIAQRAHDLDDGIASGVLSIRDLEHDFRVYDLDDLADLLKTVLDGSSINKHKGNGREFVDENDIKRAVVVSSVIRYLSNKVIEGSREKMEDYMKKHYKGSPIIDKKLIWFSKGSEDIIDNLKMIITQKVINSQEVNCFDAKASYVVRKLFKAYYSNPKQLPDSVLTRIAREIKNNIRTSTNIRTGSKGSVQDEINIYKGLKSSGNPDIDVIKRTVFMRAIADCIGGMTDEFANKQFQKLYVP